MSREAIKELCDLIDAAGGSLTFSKDCVSGIVGRDTCRCWRCRDVDPGDQEPGWERAAELITEGFHAEQRMRIRLSKGDAR